MVSGILKLIYCLATFIIFHATINRDEGFVTAAASFHVRMEQRDPKSFENDTDIIPPFAIDPSTHDEDEKDPGGLGAMVPPSEDIKDNSSVKHDEKKNLTLDALEARAAFGNDSGSTEADVETTTENTPMAFPIRGSGRLHGSGCNWYGAEVFLVQMSGIKLADNEKAMRFSREICRLNHRLECIPSRVQNANVTTPASGESGGSGIITTIQFTQSSLRRGTCRCARALSDRAIFIRPNPSEGDTFSTGCYIPAGFSHSSLCGHEVALPYGLINNGTLIRRTVGNTHSLCVPNAECRIGFKYTGLRCACIRNAVWNHRNGTCSLIQGESHLRPNPILPILMGIILTLAVSS